MTSHLRQTDQCLLASSPGNLPCPGSPPRGPPTSSRLDAAPPLGKMREHNEGFSLFLFPPQKVPMASIPAPPVFSQGLFYPSIPSRGSFRKRSSPQSACGAHNNDQGAGAEVGLETSRPKDFKLQLSGTSSLEEAHQDPGANLVSREWCMLPKHDESWSCENHLLHLPS